MSKTVFKVGMKVYDEVNFPKQELEVVKIADDNSDYPVKVKSNDGRIFTYSYDGRYLYNSNPTLSTTPYTVDFKGFSQEEPLKKGQIVWVKDSVNDEWEIAHFIEMSSDKKYKYRVSVSPLLDSIAFYCKFITTQNPYENIE